MPAFHLAPALINMLMAEIDYNEMTNAFARALAQHGNNTHISPGNPTGGQTDYAPGDLTKRETQQTLKQQEALTKGFKELNKELRHAKVIANRENQSGHVRKMSKQLSDSMVDVNKQFRTSADALHFWNSRAGKSLMNLDRRAETLRKTLEKNNITLLERWKAEKELLKVEQERAEQMDKHFGEGGKIWKKTLAAIGILAGAAGKQMYDDMRTQMGSAGIAGFFDNVKNAWLQAVDPAELSRVSKENRVAQLALANGTQNVNMMFQQTQANLGELLIRTKNMTEATELYAMTATSLVNQGIKPSEDAIMRQIKASDEMARTMGMTAIEFAKMNQELANETDIRYLLQSTMKGERGAMMQRMRDLIQYNRDMGMLPEQALRAAKALGAMSAESPLERMKKGARLAAAASALGIGGGEDIRQMLMRGGPQNAAEAQQAADFLAQLSQQRQDARQRGDLAAELMIDRMISGLDLEKTIGKGSEFNRELGQGVADLSQAAKDNVKLTSETIQDEFGVSAETFQTSVIAFEQAVNTWKNFGVGSVVGGLASSLAGGALAGGIAGRMMSGGKLFPGMGKGSGGMGRFIKGTGLGKMGMAARALGGVGLAGAAGYGTGTLLYNNSEIIRDTSQGIIAAGDLVIDQIASLFGEGTGGTERALAWWNSPDAEEAQKAVAMNSGEQLTEAQTTNELLREGNDLRRQEMEQRAAMAQAMRLEGIDMSSQGNALYAQ